MVKHCPSCDAKVDLGDNVCGECGHRLKTRRWWLVGLIVLIILVLLGVFGMFSITETRMTTMPLEAKFEGGTPIMPEGSELPSNFENLPAKEQVEVVHIQNLKYLTEGNAKKLVAAYSSNYLDLGGGPKGTGEVQLDEAYFKGFFSSEKFDELKGNPISELVDLDKKAVYSYEELPSRYGESGNKVGFKYVEGDILIIFPPKEGSPLFDGWSALYRKENGVWKIVAGD